MAEYSGYIKLWRKSLNSEVWRRPEFWRFWSYCLLRAAYEEHTITVGKKTITLHPGELVFSRPKFAEKLNLTERKIRTCVRNLEVDKIELIKRNNVSIIRILNWNKFQENKKQRPCERPENKETLKSDQANDQESDQANDQANDQETDNTNNCNDLECYDLKNESDQANDQANDPVYGQESDQQTHFHLLVKEYKEEKNTTMRKCAKVSKSEQKVSKSEQKNNFEHKFETFWKAYPKKKSKGRAKKTFKQINPDQKLFDRILQAIDQARQSREWQRENGQFIPYPATWLNAEGWEDEHSVNIVDDRINAMMQRKIRENENINRNI